MIEIAWWDWESKNFSGQKSYSIMYLSHQCFVHCCSYSVSTPASTCSLRVCYHHFPLCRASSFLVGSERVNTSRQTLTLYIVYNHVIIFSMQACWLNCNNTHSPWIHKRKLSCILTSYPILTDLQLWRFSLHKIMMMMMKEVANHVFFVLPVDRCYRLHSP